MINKNNKDQHLFELVVNDIKNKIYSGFYKPKEKLPNYVELTEIYDVSMSTIKRTMKLLNDEGLLVSRVGTGTFVNKELLERNLAKRKGTDRIAFSLINYNDANFFDVRNQIEILAKTLGKELTVNVYDNVHTHEEAISKLIKNKEVDGLLLGTSRKSVFNVKLYKNLGDEIPTIFCHDIYDSEVPIVSIDNYKVGRLAAKVLLRKSRKKLCIILDENGYKSDDLKLQGFLDELEERGHSGRSLVIRNSFNSKGSTYEDGYKLGTILDINNSEVDAAFASNDEVARGFRNALIEKKFNVKKISILGFGNIKPQKKNDYPFPTIGVDSSEFGKVLLSHFKMFFDDTGYKVPSKVLIEPKLIKRTK